MAELNALLIGYDLADDARRIGNRTLSVGQHFAFEASLLRPLPTELFQTGLVLTPRVDRYSRVTVRQCFYSVPAWLIGHQIRGVLHASELVLFNGRTEVARHERATVRGSEVLVLDHYLEVLVRKPGALRWSRPGPLGGSPARMRRSGPRPARPTAAAAAPAPWSRSCCCTATTPTPTSSRGSPRRCWLGRSAPTSSRSRPASTPSSKRSPPQPTRSWSASRRAAWLT